MSKKQQHAVGVARAIAHYTAEKCGVFVAISDYHRYDLIVDPGHGAKLLRVEVKTTISKTGEIQLRTNGGNQSWSGTCKKISCQDCDVVYCVNLKTGVEKEFGAEDLEGMSTVTVK